MNISFVLTINVIFVVLSVFSQNCNAETDDNSRWHPRLVLKKSSQGTRFKRKEMPIIAFEPPLVEEYSDFWDSVGQDILKKQLNKNKLNTNLARNVIFFLADGMSIPTITAGRVYMGGEEKQFSFEKFPYVGLSKTYCANTQVADSACAATAYLGGVKGNYATVGVSAAVDVNDCYAQNKTSNQVPSILKWAQTGGMATGLITTTSVTDASPAGIYAHTANREWENDAVLLRDKADPDVCMDIAKQLIFNSAGHNLNIILGGGRKQFIPKWQKDISGKPGKRTDNMNLIDLWKNRHSNSSMAYVQTKDELLQLPRDTKYILGLFSDDNMPYHLDADSKIHPSLEEMVNKTLDNLQSRNERYFLFVEGGRIDHGHHDVEAVRAIDETIEFDKAIELARRRTSEDDTLIVVTADHSHTMSMAGYSSRKNDIFGINNGLIGDDELPYATLSYANGPGSQRRNLRGVNMHDKDFRFPTAVPLNSETHGGDDVAVFASGPWAHLFTGNYEQNYIPHAIAYAACIGNKLTACSNISNNNNLY